MHAHASQVKTGFNWHQFGWEISCFLWLEDVSLKTLLKAVPSNTNSSGFFLQVLSSVLSEAGFDSEALIAATKDQKVKDQLRKNTERWEQALSFQRGANLCLDV